MGTYVASLKTLLGKTHWDKNLNKGKRVQHYAPPQPSTYLFFKDLEGDTFQYFVHVS
jgi:hypothetical protein